MPLLDTIITELADSRCWNYGDQSPLATEPAALAALALSGAGRHSAALPVLDWLAALQASDGSVGVSDEQAEPKWPTSLAVLAWYAFDPAGSLFRTRIVEGRRWLLSSEGHRQPRSDRVGHDTTLLGWPWVAGTHAWIEPTALALLALRLTGLGHHPRAREAALLLLDRQLPGGGCNYGNTWVLGQQLLPHTQPTALAVFALAGLPADSRLAKSVAYLLRSWSRIASTASLCYATMALTAVDRLPGDAPSRLEEAYARSQARGSSTYRLALLALASLGTSSPLVCDAPDTLSLPVTRPEESFDGYPSTPLSP